MMIWVFLPAYNEADSLPVLIPAIDKALTERGYGYRMVVVNDGSTDETPIILDELKARLPLDVLTHPINRGLGETERDGFEYIALNCEPGDRIVRVEADNTHDPVYIFSLLEKLDEGFDVVNTSRFQPGGDQKGVSTYRATISRFANIFMRLLFGIPGTQDYSCGFRAYRAEVIQDAISVFGNDFIQLRGLGFTSTLEMIVKLHILGCKFAEVPFVLRYDKKRSPSKMIASITTVGYLIMGLLYHWPFGGWHSQYHGLDRLYRNNRQQAIERYRKIVLRRSLVSQISL